MFSQAASGARREKFLREGANGRPSSRPSNRPSGRPSNRPSSQKSPSQARAGSASAWTPRASEDDVLENDLELAWSGRESGMAGVPPRKSSPLRRSTIPEDEQQLLDAGIPSSSHTLAADREKMRHGRQSESAERLRIDRMEEEAHRVRGSGRRSSYSSKLKHRLKNSHHAEHDSALRGICLNDLLAGSARLFARGGAMAGSRSFGLSQPVVSIDFFVSHAWDTPRLTKFLAMLLEFNLWPATAATLALQSLAFAAELIWFDWMPEWARLPATSPVDYTPLRVSGLSPVLTCFVFSIAVTNAHKLYPFMSRACFLDIACIPQGDEPSRARGIASLGALLDRSEEMLVLMDERYWSRLWCAFEIAAFAKRAGMARMHVVPLHIPLLETAGLCWIVSITILNALAAYVIGADEPLVVLGVAAGVETLLLVPATAVLLRALKAGQRSEAALEDLRHFRLSECECHDARDKKALLALIGEWWTTDHSDTTLTTAERHAEGWHRFEMYVRHDLRLHIEARSGSLSGSRRTLAAMAVVNNAQYLSMYASPKTNAYAAFMLVTVMLSTFAFAFPLIFRASSSLARLVAPCRRFCCGSAFVAYALLVPPTCVVIMLIFELPHMPLAWAHGYSSDGVGEGFRAYEGGTGADAMTPTQLQVLKLQLYVFALIAGGGVRI